ncbi:AAA family ATPase [Thiorhodococcus mannitoliphagus]|uniref:AAA family ATPase n=1 Tax=Thiorhodococcus mannitoliphagus TaxID=329406 RepID=A0A6P1DUR8_9GAMM|nr:AAA family ATPase [Thiorhodococcus mannitoliphagus]
MHFPYGLSDFGTLRQEGYWYLDRTDRLAALENAGRQLIFLRPRRFGKSLLLSMLEHYYDLNRADQFEALFGPLAVGQHPTRRHNQYFVLKWDFSLVAAYGEIGDIEAALHQHINDRIYQCIDDYQSHWKRAISLHPHNALSSLESLLGAVRRTPHKLYLLIDEYDNFANEVLMAAHPGGQDHSQCHGLKPPGSKPGGIQA